MVHSNAAASRRRGPEPEGPLAASAGNGGKTRDAHAAVAGALDVVGRRLASCTRTPPRADARNRRTARRQPGTPSARRPPMESRRSGTRPTLDSKAIRFHHKALTGFCVIITTPPQRSEMPSYHSNCRPKRPIQTPGRDLRDRRQRPPDATWVISCLGDRRPPGGTWTQAGG